MLPIITITLNPAIDKSTIVNTLKAEKKMYCSPPAFEPGGGGVNVARAITKLGGESTALFLGGGYTGKFFESLLNAEGQSFLAVPIAGHIRENLTVFDNEMHRQYRFVMPGPSVEKYEWEHFIEVVSRVKDLSYIVASGSLPPGVPPSIFASFSAIAGSKGARFIADTSGEALKEAIRSGAFLVKPSLNELSIFAGKQLLTDHEIISVAREITAGKKCNIVVVSMGEAGAMLVTKDMVTKITAPPVMHKSTVGAGDSMVGGIIYGLSMGKNILEAVQFGVACGTAATLNPGTGLCRQEDVQRLYRKIRAMQPVKQEVC